MEVIEILSDSENSHSSNDIKNSVTSANNENDVFLVDWNDEVYPPTDYPINEEPFEV